MNTASVGILARVGLARLALVPLAVALAWPSELLAEQSTNLVAAYPFQEGNGILTADASGNGNLGGIVNAPWTAAGRFGSALDFNGAGAIVAVENAPGLNLTAGMTLEAWVFPTLLGGWRDVIYKANDIFYLEASSSMGSLPAMGGTFSASPLYGTEPLPLNTWTHLAATYDGAMMRLFVNGLQVSSRPETHSILASWEPITIGGDGIFGQYFQGSIDEVRIYDVALTAEEVEKDMLTPIVAVPTAPRHLTAMAVSSSQVDLKWAASTSQLAILEYRVERCQGAGCQNFEQVGTTRDILYHDQGMAADTLCRYRIRAVDGAGTPGPASDPAESYTGLSVLPPVAILSSRRSQQFSTTGGREVSWAVDGLAGGSTAAGLITAEGYYTPPDEVGRHTVTASASSGKAEATVYVTRFPGMFTHHNDQFRSGQNLDEIVLTRSNVNSATFGKLFSYPLDGVAYASPLYVADLSLPGRGLRNVVYVATEHDSVYAFDADGLSREPLWRVRFMDRAAGITPVPAADTGECCDIVMEIGITGTPVIDRASGTLYVVAKTKEVTGSVTEYVQRLHALDLATGAEKFGGPVVIEASVAGHGVGSLNGRLPFNSLRQLQRTALLLVHGVVYIGFASHGDNQPYHGWVLGYQAASLRQVMAFCATPDGEGGGIWHSGGGLAADEAGNIYFVTGDGTFDANSGGSNYGDSYIKLSPDGAILDYFTPHDQATLDAQNRDLGSGGLVLLPDQAGARPHLLTGAGKNSMLYVIDRDNFGHYNPSDDSQIVQSFALPRVNFSPPAYFNQTVYYGLVNETIRAYPLRDGTLSQVPSSESLETFAYPGGALAISANRTNDGILWVVKRSGASSPGALQAYDAGNLASKLYDSLQAGSRDALDVAAKFSIPLVANGKVIVGSESRLTVYGLLGSAPTATTPRLTITCDSQAGTMTVSWPQPAEDWVLEHASTVDGAFSGWTRIAPPYQTGAKDLFIQAPAPVAGRFYRLCQP